MYTTLLDSNTLLAHLSDPNWVVIDCRFSLADVNAGQTAYEAGHIPGALYAHLDNDLSSQPMTDNGRHPLPDPETLRARFGLWGISSNTQVVTYDDANGAIASRLWWMLRYMGHDASAVLNGGWAAWQAASLPESKGVERKPATSFFGEPRRDWLVLSADVPNVPLIIDSRGEARYQGVDEPIDPVAGHIPGAKNFFFQRNWDENGRFLPAAQIRSQIEELLGEISPDEAVFYCGSGVTACVNLLALAYAGLGNGRLYAGSWSDWITDPNRPIAVGHR